MAYQQRLWPTAVGFWDRTLAGYPLPGNWTIYDAARCASLLDVPSIFAAGLIAGLTCFAYSKGRQPVASTGPAPEKD